MTKDLQEGVGSHCNQADYHRCQSFREENWDGWVGVWWKGWVDGWMNEWTNRRKERRRKKAHPKVNSRMSFSPASIKHIFHAFAEPHSWASLLWGSIILEPAHLRFIFFPSVWLKSPHRICSCQPFKAYNWVAFNIVIMFPNHHHFLAPDHSVTPQINPTPLRRSLSSLHLPSSVNHNLLSASMYLLILGLSRKWSHIIRVFVAGFLL